MNNFSALRLTIARGAKVVYDQPVAATECARQCWPGALPPAVPLHVVNLQRAREAAVVLDLYTGGAHCCSVGEVFSWDAGTSTYRQAEHDFGDPGYRLIDLSRDGRREFVSADDRFAYQFTAYAFSGLPLQVWRFAGAFTDVTRRYPRQVARDARGWLQRFRAAARQGQGLGYLAAWAADEELLHRDAAVRRELRRDLKAHLLRSTVGGPGNGSRYIAALRAFLHRAGYR
jgi:hypothetical protein